MANKAKPLRLKRQCQVLTEAQLAALEKTKLETEAHGEFDSECPGYCVARDTVYVGNLKGVGRVYQQIVIDTYSKVGFAKLYDTKIPITTAEMLNDQVLPFIEEQGIVVSGVLCSPIAAPSIAAARRATHTNSTSRWRKSTTHAPKRVAIDQRHLRAVQQNHPGRVLPGGVYTRSSTVRLRSCRLTSMSGCGTTTRSGPIRSSGAMAKPRCRRSLTHCRWPRRNCCRRRDKRHQMIVGHPPRRRPVRQTKSIRLHLRGIRVMASSAS
jgi:hypothetical protein